MVCRHTSVGMNTICSIFISRTAVYIMSLPVAAHLQTIHLLYIMIMEVPSFNIGVQVRPDSISQQATVQGHPDCPQVLLSGH